MKKIILIRHSKSLWDMPIIDFERDITSSGVESAIKMGKYTKELIPKDCHFYSSDSIRATSTAKIFIENWGFTEDQIHFTNILYTFDIAVLEIFVKRCPNHINNLILFGHNSAITDFVNKFGNIFIDNVSTSGFVTIIFDIENWAQINKGITEKVIFPRDL